MNSSPRQASLLPTASCCIRATIPLPRKRGTREKQKKKKLEQNQHVTRTSQHSATQSLHQGKGWIRERGRKGDTHPTCCSQNPPRGLRLSHQDSKNFSHKAEDLMNTVFPLMPWKNYTRKNKQTNKKKDKKFSDFLHIYKKKPPSLTTREVEQAVVGSGTGFLPDQQFLRGSHPRGAGEHGSRCRSRALS